MKYFYLNVRLYPTVEQEELFYKTVGCCRFIYNGYLASNIENYERKKTGLQQGKLKTEKQLKESYSWLKEVDATALVQSHNDLNQAVKNFFTHSSNYPKFKKKGVKESFRLQQMVNVLRVEKDKIRLGKSGFVKFKGDTSQLKGRIKSITVKLDAGKWFASILQEVEDEDYYKPVDHHKEACGIDLGVVRPLTITDGSEFWLTGKEVRAKLEKMEIRRKRYQRQMARKVKGSQNRLKAKIKVQRAYQKERFVRKDWVEKTSDKLTRTFQKIIFEDLKIGKMTRKGKGKQGLNREMLRLGISYLIKRCKDKSDRRGCEIILVDPRYSSQECSSCGYTDRKNRKSQAIFKCIKCGFKLNADKNASLNILARGLA